MCFWPFGVTWCANCVEFVVKKCEKEKTLGSDGNWALKTPVSTLGQRLKQPPTTARPLAQSLPVPTERSR